MNDNKEKELVQYKKQIKKLTNAQLMLEIVRNILALVDNYPGNIFIKALNDETEKRLSYKIDYGS